MSLQTEGFPLGRKGGGWISVPISEILAKASDDEVTNLVGETLDATKIMRGQARTTLYEKAKQVWNIRLNALPIVHITDQNPLEVADMYNRLNLKGTRIRETDTQLAYIAVRNPGWVKSVFRGFIKNLESNTNERWSLEPGLLLRCMTILDSTTPRVGDLKDQEKFWKSGCIESFEKVRNALNDILPRLERYGVYSIGDVPSNYTLIALFSFHARFSKEKNYDFDAVLRWFISANVTGRYGNAPLQRLTEDAGKFMKSDNPNEALKALDLELPKDEIARALDEEFAEPFKRNSPGALLLKVLLWNKAIDWRQGGKLSTYPPLEWHHIIPKKALKNMAADESVANHIANLTLLSTTANKEFKDQPPWIYAPNAIQDSTRLESHFIPKSYATAFTAGKAINKPDELAKFLAERLKLIQKETKQLLNL
jgi:predicted nucleic acid-binding protein